MVSEPIINSSGETTSQPDAGASEAGGVAGGTKSTGASVHVRFGTTFAHRAFLLVSTSFSLFGLIFLWLYSDRVWFGIDLLICTIPTAIFVCGATHYLLKWLETPVGCKCSALISKGLPFAPYERWVEINEPGFEAAIRFGNRRAIWSAIDRVELTFFGNLYLLSRSNSGAEVRGAKGFDANPPAINLQNTFRRCFQNGPVSAH